MKRAFLVTDYFLIYFLALFDTCRGAILRADGRAVKWWELLLKVLPKLEDGPLVRQRIFWHAHHVTRLESQWPLCQGKRIFLRVLEFICTVGSIQQSKDNHKHYFFFKNSIFWVCLKPLHWEFQLVTLIIRIQILLFQNIRKMNAAV